MLSNRTVKFPELVEQISQKIKRKIDAINGHSLWNQKTVIYTQFESFATGLTGFKKKTHFEIWNEARQILFYLIMNYLECGDCPLISRAFCFVEIYY
jgi:hypothetical protein